MDTQEIGQMMEKLNLDAGKLQELATALQSNPFAAMSKIQELGITMDMIQTIMKLVMANPTAFVEAAKQAGVSEEALSMMKNQMDRFS